MGHVMVSVSTSKMIKGKLLSLYAQADRWQH